MQESEIAVKVAFKRRIEEIKEDLEAGRITFHNPPEVWTERLINITALNLVLLVIAEEAQWN